MRFSYVMISAVLLCFANGSVHAQGTQPGERWQYTEQTNLGRNAAWNYAPQGGGAEIGVMCGDNGPFVYIADGLFHDIDSYSSEVALAIDRQDFSRSATFIPNDTGTYWRVGSTDGLLEALRMGSRATFRTDTVETTFRVNLVGSNAAIEQVLARCGSSGSGVTAASSADPDEAASISAAAEARVRDNCQGSYSGDGSIVEANVDGDSRPDVLIDWSKVSCASNAVGRGGGNCGMQMCSIDVYASSTCETGGWPQPILAYSYELAAPGKDHVMRTVISGASCPITHRCTRFWGWTGDKLEVIRSEEVDVSQVERSTSAAQDSAFMDQPSQPEISSATASSGGRDAGTSPAEESAKEVGDEYWESIGVEPNQWNSVVPESAMVFLSAFYIPGSRDFSASLSYGPSLPSLGLGVGSVDMT